MYIQLKYMNAILQTQYIIDDHNNIFYYKIENKEERV